MESFQVEWKELVPCPYRKSNPNVPVMESAKEWNGLDAPDRPERPGLRRLSGMLRLRGHISSLDQ
jgi:hypothetical protein